MIKRFLQPNEIITASVDAKVDVRSHLANTENPVPWADLLKPKHDGSVALTQDRLLIVFNPGNMRAVSVLLRNVLLAWERGEGRKPYPPQLVFVLPAGMFCVCEVESNDAPGLRSLRQMVHELARLGSLSAAVGSVAESGGGDGGESIAIMAAVT